MAQRLSGAQGQGDGGGQGRWARCPREERPAYGRRVNEVKRGLEAAYEARGEALKQAARAQSLVCRPGGRESAGRPSRPGRLHPATRTLREIYRIFAEMGFQVYRSRDVETDDYNFTLLNMPPHHPARDMWDTFYTTTPGVILRTHTSPGQIHAMRQYYPEPIRVILPGMCYRYEQITARSEIMFNQVEGLAVGTAITMADLKGTIVDFAQRHVWRGPPGALPGQPLSLHRAERRGGYGLHPVRGEGLPGVQVHRLAGDHGLWHGPPGGAGEWWLRSGRLLGLCLWHGTGADRHAQVWHRATFAISGGTICDSWSSSARSASGAVSPLYRRA